MGVDRRHEKLAIGKHHTAEFAAQIPLPRAFQLGRDGCFCEAAARRVVAIGGPVVRIFDFWLSIINFTVCRAALESVSVRYFLRDLAGGGRRSQSIESIQLRLNVAGTRMLWRVNQPVRRHNTVKAGASHPVICGPVFRGRINEFDTGSRR